MRKWILAIFLIFLVIVVFGLPQFFLSNKNKILPEQKEIFLIKKPVSILNFGDVMLDRNVRKKIEKDGVDVFEYVKRDSELIKDFDFIIANLEGPIVEMNRSLCQNKAYNFQFASTAPAILKSIGINIVSIANNHINDCYKEGIESTKKYLDESGVGYIGDFDVEKSFITREVNGKKVAFVGIDRTISSTPISDFYDLIKILRLENDYLIVNIHWGEEYNKEATEEQKNIAHALIDEGVDVVFGHHPHVVEPVEVYKNKVIFYSLGNFVFDQIGEERNFGIGGGVEFGESANSFTVFPYKIKSSAPEFLGEIDRKKFCDEYLKNLKPEGCSFKLNTNF
jgi:poly-gamma-glutamate synthesis protein (capsule biosynthesis protein)